MTNDFCRLHPKEKFTKLDGEARYCKTCCEDYFRTTDLPPPNKNNLWRKKLKEMNDEQK